MKCEWLAKAYELAKSAVLMGREPILTMKLCQTLAHVEELREALQEELELVDVALSPDEYPETHRENKKLLRRQAPPDIASGPRARDIVDTVMDSAASEPQMTIRPPEAKQ